jgi:hypothetical protein
MIITARLRAMPAMEMRIMGPEKEDRLSLLKVRRVAMNSSVFKNESVWAAKILNIVAPKPR